MGLTLKKDVYKGLEITELYDGAYLIHQIKATQRFTRCDGIIFMPLLHRNELPIIIDVNIEPEYIPAVLEYLKFDDYIQKGSRVRRDLVDDNSKWQETRENKRDLIYIVSHSHLDHSSHVFKWEEYGGRILAPIPHGKRLLNHDNLIDELGFGLLPKRADAFDFIELMGFDECKLVETFKPGDVLRFDNLRIETIPLNGHSIGHIGFKIDCVTDCDSINGGDRTNEHDGANVRNSDHGSGKTSLALTDKFHLHISCIGFDLPSIDADEKAGFGPWYGFPECSIPIYLQDIDSVENLFCNAPNLRTDGKYPLLMTSSHSFPFLPADLSHLNPFEYMRKKIRANNIKVKTAADKIPLYRNIIKNYNQSGKLVTAGENLEDIINGGEILGDLEEIAGELLKVDLFFPKKRMSGLWYEIYGLWEYWIIFNTLKYLISATD